MPSTGYGRGYYGEGQLAPQPRHGSGWIKLGLVVGVGAVVWYMWPRKTKPDYGANGGGGGDGPRPVAPAPMSPLPEWQAPLAPISQGGYQEGQSHAYLPQQTYLAHQTYDDAQSRGYASQQAYEDAMVASARQLQDTGARVTLAPHFQYLTPRLGP
jgi:hypothetical protein